MNLNEFRGTQSNATKIKIRQCCPPCPFLFNIILEDLARKAIRQQKGITGIEIRKKEAKKDLFADDIIVYMSDPKNSTGKFL